MTLAFFPNLIGSDSQLTQLAFASGAIMASHPFEVARVMIVNDETSHITGRAYATLRRLYTNEGVAGLYKGFIPRALHTLPVVMTMGWMIDSTDWGLSLPLPNR